jgi:hypothetical protein
MPQQIHDRQVQAAAAILRRAIHDIRSELTGVVGSGELIAMSTTDPKISGWASLIVSASGRIERHLEAASEQILTTLASGTSGTPGPALAAIRGALHRFALDGTTRDVELHLTTEEGSDGFVVADIVSFETDLLKSLARFANTTTFERATIVLGSPALNAKGQPTSIQLRIEGPPGAEAPSGRPQEFTLVAKSGVMPA